MYRRVIIQYDGVEYLNGNINIRFIKPYLMEYSLVDEYIRCCKAITRYGYYIHQDFTILDLEYDMKDSNNFYIARYDYIYNEYKKLHRERMLNEILNIE